MQTDTVIRPVTEEDAEALLSVYAPYVTDTAITFESEVPTVEAVRERIRQTLSFYPYLALARGEKILGYAYAGPFHPRDAYLWCVETSLYVAVGEHGKGYGRLLHDALERELASMGILSMEACIGVPADGAETGPFLDRNSQHFHSHMGYRLVGCFSRCGYKFGNFYDMIWMEKHIGSHEGTPEPVKPWRGCALQAGG